MRYLVPSLEKSTRWGQWLENGRRRLADWPGIAPDMAIGFDFAFIQRKITVRYQVNEQLVCTAFDFKGDIDDVDLAIWEALAEFCRGRALVNLSQTRALEFENFLREQNHIPVFDVSKLQWSETLWAQMGVQWYARWAEQLPLELASPQLLCHCHKLYLGQFWHLMNLDTVTLEVAKKWSAAGSSCGQCLDLDRGPKRWLHLNWLGQFLGDGPFPAVSWQKNFKGRDLDAEKIEGEHLGDFIIQVLNPWAKMVHCSFELWDFDNPLVTIKARGKAAHLQGIQKWARHWCQLACSHFYPQKRLKVCVVCENEFMASSL